MANQEEILTINVGGTKYTTSKKSLTKYEGSHLAKLCNSNAQGDPRDTEGNLFFDGDGDLFKYVLRFLKTGKLNLPERFNDTAALAEEASYYGLEVLKRELEQYRKTRAEILWVKVNDSTIMEYKIEAATYQYYVKFIERYKCNTGHDINLNLPENRPNNMIGVSSLKQNPGKVFETLAKEGYEQKISYNGYTLYCKYS